MAEKKPTFNKFEFGDLTNMAAQESPTPALDTFFNPTPQPPVEPPTVAYKVVPKGGRPKGIPKTKKTFYLATDLSRLEEMQINLSRHAGIRAKDESDTVDLALELLDHLAGLGEYAALINTIHKKRLSR